MSKLPQNSYTAEKKMTLSKKPTLLLVITVFVLLGVAGISYAMLSKTDHGVKPIDPKTAPNVVKNQQSIKQSSQHVDTQRLLRHSNKLLNIVSDDAEYNRLVREYQIAQMKR
ncbi:unnamed protein product, partial [marine sediment metagenome]